MKTFFSPFLQKNISETCPVKFSFMLIQNKKINSKGMFFVEIDGNILAEMTYTMPSPEKMIIEHTEVSNELRGKDVGNQLVHTAVEYARSHHIKIIPLCPLANSVFKKKTEFSDILVR